MQISVVRKINWKQLLKLLICHLILLNSLHQIELINKNNYEIETEYKNNILNKNYYYYFVCGLCKTK